MRRICVFCGSRNGSQPEYREAARHLAKEMAARGIGLVYGGGNVGLMGMMAHTMLEEGGEVIGVIPQFLVEKELMLEEATVVHVVETMHERKALMADLCDAFLALPGGFGTLEEICEMITWAQLSLHRKPCGILNCGGFFASLLSFFDHQVQEGFVTAANRRLVIDGADPLTLLNRLEQEWSGNGEEE